MDTLNMISQSFTRSKILLTFWPFHFPYFILGAVKEIKNRQLWLVLRTRGLVSVKVLEVWSLAILVALSTCGFAPGLTSPHSGGQLKKSVKSNLMSCLPKSKGWTESLGALQEGLWLWGWLRHEARTDERRLTRSWGGPFQLPRVIMWALSLYCCVSHRCCNLVLRSTTLTITTPAAMSVLRALVMGWPIPVTRVSMVGG